MQTPPLVCIVEDDESVRSAVGSLVRALGYDVGDFASSEEFLSLDHVRPDCMICDMQLPGMSGVDLFTLMRRHGRHVPTIFITAFEPERVRRLAGPDVIVFAKPFDSAELEKALQRILGG